MIENTDLKYNSFQKEFAFFLKAGGIPEKVSALCGILRSIMFYADIEVAYKRTIESVWEEADTGFRSLPRSVTVMGVRLSSGPEYFNGRNYTETVLIALSDSSFIGILLNQEMTRNADTEKIMLQLIISTAGNEFNSTAAQKKEKELIFSLNEKILQLNSLIDTGIELSKFDRRDVLFELALERACALINSSSAMLRVMKDGSDAVAHYVFPAETNPAAILQSSYKIESSFFFNGQSYLFTLSGKETRAGTTSFSDLDTILLEAICKQVFVVIENEFLQQQIILKQRYEQELTVAASIQQRIIPDKLPQIKGYEVAGINIPSREVGGDYYDCIDLGTGKYAFIIADVSGKGIAAALLVNTLNAALYSYLEFDFPLNEMTGKLNKLIYNSSPSDKFITFFIAVLDSNTGTLTAVNAGHNPILLLRSDGYLEMIQAGGVGLGMFNLGLPFKEQKIILNPGDKLFLYTDGIPEAMNLSEEEYSDERMIGFFRTNSGKSAEELVKELVQDVRMHTGTAEQSDDITALYLKRQT